MAENHPTAADPAHVLSQAQKQVYAPTGAPDRFRPGLAGFAYLHFNDEPAEVALRAEELRASFQTADGYHDWVVRQLAVASVRLDRAAWHEWSILAHDAKRANLVWDADREVEALELADRLPKKPEKVAKRLEESLHGVDWMVERWEFLARAAESGKPWTDDQRARALDLLGTPLDLREIPRPFDEDAVKQSQLARHQLKRLNGLLPQLRDLDEEGRQLTLKGLSPRPSAGLKAQRREESRNSRVFNQMLGILNARRRQRPIASPRSPAPAPVPASAPKAPPQPPRIPDPPAMRAERPAGVHRAAPNAPNAPRHDLVDKFVDTITDEAQLAGSVVPALGTKPLSLALQTPERPMSRRDRRARDAKARRR